MENTLNQGLVPAGGLVDIQNISVDVSLPKDARIAEFVRQIRNPYQFHCEGFTVSARFLPGAPSLEDCLSRLLAT